MNGYVAYIPVVAMFLAKIEGNEQGQLDNFGAQVVLFVLSLAAAISAAGVPQGHFVITLGILKNLGVSTDQFELILVSDLLVER